MNFFGIATSSIPFHPLAIERSNLMITFAILLTIMVACSLIYLFLLSKEGKDGDPHPLTVLSFIAAALGTLGMAITYFNIAEMVITPRTYNAYVMSRAVKRDYITRDEAIEWKHEHSSRHIYTD